MTTSRTGKTGMDVLVLDGLTIDFRNEILRVTTLLWPFFYSALPMAFWFVLLYYLGNFYQVKAKNVGIAIVLSRLFNADMRKIYHKAMDKSNRLWYILPLWKDKVLFRKIVTIKLLTYTPIGCI